MLLQVVLRLRVTSRSLSKADGYVLTPKGIFIFELTESVHVLDGITGFDVRCKKNLLSWFLI